MSNQLIDFNASQFLTLPNEELIVAKKEHWIVLLPPVILCLLLLFISLGFVTTLYALNFLGVAEFLVCFLLILAFNFAGLANLFVGWCFHIHIVTNRKILEIRSSPLMKDRIDNVFLDQVRTTEVDVKMHNFLMELFDVGDVVLAFDRPSHEEVFTLKNIKYPRRIGLKLADTLETLMEQGPSVWFNNQHNSDHILVAEDIPNSYRSSVEPVQLPIGV